MYDTTINSALGLTVNQLLTRHPASLSILHSLGIHTCCTANDTVAAAAAKANVDEDVLADALRPVIAGAPVR